MERVGLLERKGRATQSVGKGSTDFWSVQTNPSIGPTTALPQAETLHPQTAFPPLQTSPLTPPQVVPPIADRSPPKAPKKKRALDLFTGSGSVAQALRKQGFEVYTLDINPRCNANYTVDILEWPAETIFKPGFFELIAASPPCTEYSNAMTRRPREMEKADLLVERTIQIINFLKPPKWWIENPRHGRLSTRDVVRGLHFVDIDFCRFSTWGYKKPTRFWCSHNIAPKGNVLCEGKCANLEPSPYGGFRHKFVIANRYRQEPPDRHNQVIKIPEAVVHYLTGFSAPPLAILDDPKIEWKVVGLGKKCSMLKPFQHAPQEKFV